MNKEKVFNQVKKTSQAVVLSAMTFASSLPFAESVFGQSSSSKDETAQNSNTPSKGVEKAVVAVSKAGGSAVWGKRLSDEVDGKVIFEKVVMDTKDEEAKPAPILEELSKKGSDRIWKDGSTGVVAIPTIRKAKSQLNNFDEHANYYQTPDPVAKFIKELNERMFVGAPNTFPENFNGVFENTGTGIVVVQRNVKSGDISLGNLGPAVLNSVPENLRLKEPTDDAELIKKFIAANDPWSCKGLIVPATYYNLQGNRTANGEVMYASASTTAVPLSHRHLMGRSARVTEMSGGASEIVRVNDTGLMNTPAYPGTWLDVTEGVAIRQGWKSRGKVTVCFEVLG